MWSLCHNALSTKDNLYRRKIITDPTCQICHQHTPETTEHIFLHCPWTRKIWSHSAVKLNPTDFNTNRMDAWLADLICKKKAIPDLETLAHILWHLWKSRNLFVFRRAVPDPQQVILAAFSSAQSACRSHEVWTRSSPNLLTSEHLWKPPDLWNLTAGCLSMLCGIHARRHGKLTLSSLKLRNSSLASLDYAYCSAGGKRIE